MDAKQAVLDLKLRTVARPDGAMYQQLLRDQQLAPEELRALQLRRGSELAVYAWDTTDFYRDYYSAAGFSRDDLRAPEAFLELPVVEKAHLREASARFEARGVAPKHRRFASTGGSTGEPVRLLHDRRVPVRTLSWRMFGWWGVSPSDDIAHVYRHIRSPRQELKHALQWWPTRSIQIDAYRMDDASIEKFLAGYRKLRPRLVLGYVGGIHELARVLIDRGIVLPAPTAVGVTAAPLSAVQRAAIRQAFQAPVYDHYRCGEIPWIAAECRAADGLHSFGDVRFVEVVDGAGQRVPAGTVGETVVSDLTNRAFPLIRYRIGDRAAMIDRACSCGVGLPLMTSVGGRVSDALVMPNGRIVAGEGLTAIFDDWPESVKAFQIWQKADANIVLRCVVGTDPDALKIIDGVLETLRGWVQNQVSVDLELVEEIPHDGGKTRYIKSDVRA